MRKGEIVGSVISLLILFCIGSGVSELVIQDLSDASVNKMYAFFMPSGGFECPPKKFTFFVTDSEATDQIRIEAASSNINASITSSNFTSMLFNFNLLTSNLITGEFQFTINSGLNVETFTYASPCIAPPTTLDIEVLNSNYSMMTYTNEISGGKMLPFFYFKVKNFDETCGSPILDLFLNQSCIFPSFKIVWGNIYQGGFLINCTMSSLSDKFYELFEQDLYFSVGVSQSSQYNNNFVIHSYLKRSNSPTSAVSLESVKLYPKTTNNIVFANIAHVYLTLESNEYDLPILSFLSVTTSLNMAILGMRNNTKLVFVIPFSVVAPSSLNTFSIANTIVKSDSTAYNVVIPTLPATTSSDSSLTLNNSNDLVTYTCISNCSWCYSLALQADNLFLDTIIEAFPYGFTRGNSKSFNYTTDLFFSSYVEGFLNTHFNLGNANLQIISSTPDSIAPKILSYKIYPIIGTTYQIARIKIVDEISGFNKLTYIGDYRNIVEGSVWDGEYDFLIQKSLLLARYGLNSYIVDFALNFNNMFFNQYNNLNLDTWDTNYLNFSTITNIRFEYNDIDVSDSSFENRLFIYTSQPDPRVGPVIFLRELAVRGTIPSVIFIGSWSYDLGCYVIPFEVKRNYNAPVYNFNIYSRNSAAESSIFKNLFGSDAELRVKSTLGDI
ncbi:hypothetical protein CYY_010488, partial [Polysphondylium violaceum]